MDQLSFIALGKIIWIDVLLSGDNAVVIALACLHLPPHRRPVAMIAGTVLAVALRIACTGSASYLMTLPYLKVLGGAALLYIATKLLAPNGDDDGGVRSGSGMARAIIAIVIADISMSIDNVLAVAAAAAGNVVLLSIGLLISIPLVVGGASIISKIIDKLPILVWAGSALLGWIAGETIASDPLLHTSADAIPFLGAVGAIMVLVAGAAWRGCASGKSDAHNI